MNGDMDSLLDKYKYEPNMGQQDIDDKIKVIGQMLDLRASTEAVPDWHSTRAFQIFLEALDVGESRISLTGDHKSPKLPAKSSRTDTSNHESASNDIANKCHESSSYQKQQTAVEDSPAKKSQNNNDETILSAEALKILSELPDLSHMSFTRSFVFPKATSKSSKR